MQLEWLEEFAKVASTQSITQAALELNLTQPCLSKHMRDVEATSPLDDVREGRADVTFSQLSAVSDLTGLDADPIFSDAVVCVIPQGHALADRDRLALADLDGQTICFYSDVTTYEHGALIREILAAAGVSYRERRLPWDRNARDMRNYQFADGILLESASHIEYDVPRHALTGFRVVPLEDGAPLLPMSIIYRHGETNPGVKGFVEKILAVV